MNEKLHDLDAIDQLQAELDWTKKQRKVDEQKMAELRNAITQVTRTYCYHGYRLNVTMVTTRRYHNNDHLFSGQEGNSGG